MKANVTRTDNNSDLNVITQTTEVEVCRAGSIMVPADWTLKEDKSNKVQNIGPNSTAAQYPSAKCVYEALQQGGFSQIQSDWTQMDDTQVDFIKHKPSLATVATSGSYNDLNDQPTIPVVPTDLSDFNNDVGFITLTDVPEQVNSDWNSNSGKSQILNRPDLSLKQDKSNLVQTISSSSLSTEYPSALAVYNYIQSLDGSQISY